MKLKKAIEILTARTNEWEPILAPDIIGALKLLIEAGKTIELCRSNQLPFPVHLLPGETEE